MPSSLSPWFYLLLGILIGWVIEWFVDLWFFRRDRLQAQNDLQKTEADLRACRAELGQARSHADLFEIEPGGESASSGGLSG